MEGVRCTLYLLLLLNAGAAFARGVSGSDLPREYPCPPETAIQPCICIPDFDTYEISLDCSAIMTDEELIHAFNTTFPFPTANELTIDHTDAQFDDHLLETLTQDSFGAVSFQHIDIRGTTLTAVLEGTFQNSHETLLSLRLPANKLSSFTFEVVGEFTRLTTLVLSGNKFEGELIKPITSSTLKVLNLNNNPMINIAGDFVKDCPALQSLHLHNTGQTALPLLPESPISMIHGLNDIYMVDLSENAITELETNSFMTGTGGDDTLTNINLSRNEISLVFPKFVSGLVNDGATVLDLSSNSIELMDQTVWEDILTDINPGKVNLEDNPLTCGCDIAWLVVDQPSLMSAITENTMCLTGNPVVTLPPEAFDQCP